VPPTDECEQAWRTLYDEQVADVHRLVRRCGVAAAEVEDVTQQVFVIALRRLRDGEEIRCVPAWLRAIAIRVTSEYHRWWRVRRIKRGLLEVAECSREDVPTPERATEVAETQLRVSAVLRQMSPKLRAVLVLCDLHECSVCEAADALEIPINTVRSRRVLARRLFRALWLEAEGLADPCLCAC
jgi:RNA polymerase sigma-70 factor, ECF subfamily